jgi:hypothetical protein
MAQYRRKSDGVTSMTKKRLVAEGLNTPEDFNMPTAKAPRAVAPVGDPTRKVSQAEYDVMAAAQKKRRDAAYLKSRMGRKPRAY